ncbi:MAG: hypothetical protein ACYTGZ_03240 [Planctomycetota bacterium]|jgi:hypothetical protein
MRLLATTIILLLVGCGAGGDGDVRTAELWVIDFQTHADDVDAVVARLDLDPRLLQDSTMERLRAFYAGRFVSGGFAIFFELGKARRSSTTSSICLSNGDGRSLGRGALDIGNDNADFDCGVSDRERRGVFVDRIADVFEPQVASLNLTVAQRTEFFAGLLALALAHEIGHGLGLEHTTGIMATLPDFDIRANHAFTRAQEMLLDDNIVR